MANVIGQLLVELGVNTAAFKSGLDKATYQAKAWSGQIKGSFNELGSSITGLARELGASFGPVGGAIDVVSAAMKTLSTTASGIGSGVAPALTAIVGIAGGAAAALIGVAAADAMMAMKGHEAAESLILMSDKMGVSIDHVQDLKSAGEAVNLPIERMQMGMRRLSGELADMGLKSTKATDLLAKLGVTAKDPYQAMLQIADGISKATDKTTQLNEANTIFGPRMGGQLLPLLVKGAAGFKEYADSVDEFGQRVDTSMVKGTEGAKKSTVDLSNAWEGLKLEFASSQWMNTAVEGLAHLTKGLGEVAAGDPVKSAFLLPVFRQQGNQPGSAPQAGNASADGSKAAQAAAEASREAAAKAEAGWRNLWLAEKEGGPAGEALADALLKIKEDTEDASASNYKEADSIQKTIPALQEAARLEKERNQALLNLPKTTKAAVDEQSVTVTKAYAEALKALGDASKDAAAAEEAEATIQKFANKQKEEGIAGDPAATGALKTYSDAVHAATASTTQFGRAAEVGKLLDAYAKSADEATKKTEAMSEATSKVGKVWAGMDDGLDKAKRALDEEAKSLWDNITAGIMSSEDIARASALYVQHTQKLEADTAAMQGRKNAAKDLIDSEMLTKQKQEIKQEQDYLNLLKSMPEAMAKVTAAAMAKANAADPAAMAQVLANEKQIYDLNQKIAAQTAAEGAMKAQGVDPEQLSMLTQEYTDLQAIQQQWAATTPQYKAATDAMAQLNAQYQELTAKSGGFFAGATAGFAKFDASVQTTGTFMATEVNNALTGVSDSIAKLIATGKAGWANLEQSMEESLLKFAASSAMKSALKAIGGLFSNSGNGFLSSIGSAISGGSMGGSAAQTAAVSTNTATLTANTTALAMNTAALQAAALKSSMGGLGGGGGSDAGGGAFDSLFSSDDFGGGMAAGGDVTPGKFYLIGEHGPEILAPGSSGTVVPNGAGGGGNVTVVQNIQTPSPDAFRASQAQLHSQAFNAVSRSATRFGGR